MLIEKTHRNLTRNCRNPKKYQMPEKSNPILHDIWFFLEISPLALPTINSTSTEETENAERKSDFGFHIKTKKKPKKKHFWAAEGALLPKGFS